MVTVQVFLEFSNTIASRAGPVRNLEKQYHRDGVEEVQADEPTIWRR